MTWIRNRLQYPIGPRYAVKVALAAGLATLVVQVFHMTYPFFAPLSAIIVMDTTARADTSVARARLIGAVGGGALGYVGALVAPDDWWSVAIVVLIVMLIGIAFHLGAATRQMAVVAAVIVMAPVGTDLARYAGSRIIETAIGIAAALLVSRFVWPPHIAAETRELFATLFGHFRELYDVVVAGRATPVDRTRFGALEDQIQTDMEAINDRWDAALAELPTRDVLAPELRVVSRRIRSSIVAMNTALLRRPPEHDRLATLAEPVTNLTDATSAALGATADALHRPHAPFPDVSELETRIGDLLVAAAGIDGPGAGPGAVLAEFTYLFMLREVATRLVDLADPGATIQSAVDTNPATPNP